MGASTCNACSHFDADFPKHIFTEKPIPEKNDQRRIKWNQSGFRINAQSVPKLDQDFGTSVKDISGDFCSYRNADIQEISAICKGL